MKRISIKFGTLPEREDILNIVCQTLILESLFFRKSIYNTRELCRHLKRESLRLKYLKFKEFFGKVK
jgi:hypothetical protein